MKTLKLLTALTLCLTFSCFAQNQQEEGESLDKALRKLQPASDAEEAAAILKAYFDNAVNRVCSVRYANEAAFQVYYCNLQLQYTTDLASINALRKQSLKMQGVQSSVVAAHEAVLVKDKRLSVVKSLGVNSVYKANKSAFDNLLARLEGVVASSCDQLISKGNQLMSSTAVKATDYISATHPIMCNFFQSVDSLRSLIDPLASPSYTASSNSAVSNSNNSSNSASSTAAQASSANSAAANQSSSAASVVDTSTQATSQSYDSTASSQSVDQSSTSAVSADQSATAVGASATGSSVDQSSQGASSADQSSSSQDSSAASTVPVAVTVMVTVPAGVDSSAAASQDSSAQVAVDPNAPPADSSASTSTSLSTQTDANAQVSYTDSTVADGGASVPVSIDASTVQA